MNKFLIIFLLVFSSLVKTEEVDPNRLKFFTRIAYLHNTPEQLEYHLNQMSEDEVEVFFKNNGRMIHEIALQTFEAEVSDNKEVYKKQKLEILTNFAKQKDKALPPIINQLIPLTSSLDGTNKKSIEAFTSLIKGNDLSPEKIDDLVLNFFKGNFDSSIIDLAIELNPNSTVPNRILSESINKEARYSEQVLGYNLDDYLLNNPSILPLLKDHNGETIICNKAEALLGLISDSSFENSYNSEGVVLVGNSPSERAVYILERFKKYDTYFNQPCSMGVSPKDIISLFYEKKNIQLEKLQESYVQEKKDCYPKLEFTLVDDLCLAALASVKAEKVMLYNEDDAIKKENYNTTNDEIIDTPGCKIRVLDHIVNKSGKNISRDITIIMASENDKKVFRGDSYESLIEAIDKASQKDK